jgi:hypothetical protein
MDDGIIKTAATMPWALAWRRYGKVGPGTKRAHHNPLCGGRAIRDASKFVGRRLSVASHRLSTPSGSRAWATPHPSLPGIVRLARPGPTVARRVWPGAARQPGLRIGTGRRAP